MMDTHLRIYAANIAGLDLFDGTLILVCGKIS
jgi:hypothetical protein